jgi:quinol monooxygenase YgiN
MIHVVATLTVRPGTRTGFLDHFARLEPLVRAEDGCLEYAAAIDVASGLGSQAPLRPDVVMVIEKWRDLAALVAHSSAPHMNAWRAAVADSLVSVEIQVLAPADQR